MELPHAHIQRENIAFYTRKSESSFRPSVVWIEPTNICNLRCKMCPQGSDLMTRKKGMMDFSLLEKIIGEVKEWKPSIKFFHMGESLLHPRIGEMISYASKAGCFTMLNTNATLLDEGKAAMLLESGLDYISFSFDGATKEVYETIRVGANFDRTLKNIIGFLEMKGRSRKNKPFVTVEMVGMKDTEHEVSGFRKQFESLPVDEIRIKKLVNWAGKVNVEGEAEKVYSDLSCVHPWSFSVILWDGRVVPCCRDFDGKYVLGDVSKERLIDIWNKGEKMIDLRKKLASEGGYRGISLCKDCSEIYTDWDGISRIG